MPEATPAAVQALAQELLHEPVHVAATSEPDREPAAAAPIEQHAVQVDAAQRTPLLRHLIAEGGWTRRTIAFPENGSLHVSSADDQTSEAFVLYGSCPTPPTPSRIRCRSTCGGWTR